MKAATAFNENRRSAAFEHTQDERNPGYSAEAIAHWVYKAGQDRRESKDALARYVAGHFVDYGMVVFMGPGTTNNCLARRIFDRQIETRTPLDLAILTNNLTIFALGADLAKQHPDLLRTTQIISTGGTFHQSINSVVGRFAANAIESSVLRPHLVLLGAAGVSFDEPEGALTYHFEDELATQVAFATCRTEKRILICDHTKLETSKRWRGCTIKDLVRNTGECIIVTSIPTQPPEGDENDKKMALYKKEKEIFEKALISFSNLLERLRADDPTSWPLPLRLQVIDADGKVVKEIAANQ